MKSLTKYLTPDELRIVWILTAVLLLGIGGRIWIASHSGSASRSTPTPSPASVPAP
jgi:hypothetical protein